MKHFWRRTHAERQQLEFEKDRLEAVKARWPEVNDAADTMKERLRRNHFAEAIGKAMGVTK